MKCQRINRIHDIHASLHLPMAFKRIFSLLALIARIEKLNRNSSLNAAACITLPVWHAADSPCHEFERALATLPGLGHLADVVEVDGAGGHGYDESVVDGGGREDFVRLWVLGGLPGGARVKEADGVVPGTGD